MMPDLEALKTWVEIDLAALRANLRALQQVIGPGRQIILVVKSDAYGHGAGTVASVAAAEGVRHFAVATVDEGIALRRADVSGEILLLHAPLEFEIPAIIEWRLTPTIADEGMARRLSRQAGGTPVSIQIEINTGLNRLGVDAETAVDTIARIVGFPNLRIAGIFTHFRAHYAESDASIRQQMERFASVLTALKARNIPTGMVHAASSIPMILHAETYLDGIRPGMIAYGGIALGPGENGRPLPSALTEIRPVMSARTRIIQIRRVQKGEWLHYGEAFQTIKLLNVAVLPIGYGMGYSRHFSNKGQVLIRGRRCPILGVVGMDLTIVDVDDLPDVTVGEVATLLGQDGNDSITPWELAEWAGTISYEVTCRLGNALPRIIVQSEIGKSRMVSSSSVSC